MGAREKERDQDVGSGAGAEHRRIRILFLAANPETTAQLGLQHEVRKIQEKLSAARYRDRFELTSRWAVRTEDLMQALLEVEPDIVHFSGHGNMAEELILEDERGRPFPVGKDVLAHLFSVLKDRIRLVVLNACYSLPQARAIVEHVDGAVGMGRAFGDSAAIEFSASFYQGLAFDRSLREAFEMGRIAIKLKGISEAQTPELLTREGVSPDGRFLVPH